MQKASDELERKTRMVFIVLPKESKYGLAKSVAVKMLDWAQQSPNLDLYNRVAVGYGELSYIIALRDEVVQPSDVIALSDEFSATEIRRVMDEYPASALVLISDGQRKTGLPGDLRTMQAV